MIGLNREAKASVNLDKGRIQTNSEDTTHQIRPDSAGESQQGEKRIGEKDESPMNPADFNNTLMASVSADLEDNQNEAKMNNKQLNDSKDKPLLEKAVIKYTGFTATDCFNTEEILSLKDVIDALKKFKEGYDKIVFNSKKIRTICSKCGIGYYIYINICDNCNEYYCLDFWFNKCFGDVDKK